MDEGEAGAKSDYYYANIEMYEELVKLLESAGQDKEVNREELA